MTAPQAPEVTPERGSRLAQLAADYELAKAEAEESKARFEELKNELKAELRGVHPEADRIELTSVPVPLTVKRVVAWKIDSKLLKAERPEVWVSYAHKTESWRLDPVKP